MRVSFIENTVRLQERRLTRRVEEIWREIGEGGLPSWGEMKADRFGEDWRYCFGVDLSLSEKAPYFLYLGEGLEQAADAWTNSPGGAERAVIDLVGDRLDVLALERKAQRFGGGVNLSNGRRMVFRGVVLPLSENGEDITHAFGAANCRFL
ncbi:MAG: hypothetical protein AAGD92_04375 [Pseudomonadota bacterium]